jgi:hypothetical protein
MLEIPKNLSDEKTLFNEWFLRIVDEFFNSPENEIHSREYGIIEYRFGLNGKSFLTLEEIGIIYDVTRERIRQIEKTALDNLAELVNKGVNSSRKVKLNPKLSVILKDYKDNLSHLNEVVNEIFIANHTAEYFSEANISLPLLRLLLTILGFDKINIETGIPESSYVWAFTPIDSKRIEKALRTVFDYLREVSVAKPFDEIKLAVNKNKKPEARFTDSELNLAIDLSYDIERLEDSTIQLRYDKLHSIADKAYRILHNFGEPISSQQLAIILNKEAVKHGEKSRISSHHIGSRLSSDNRFESIGRNGGWILNKWEDYTTEKIIDLMQDALHEVGKPLSCHDIYSYVIARRPVKETAVTSYLSYDRRFARVGPDQFALSDWGIPSVASSRPNSRERVFSKAKLCDYIEKAFSINETNEMFLTDLAREISSLESNSNPQAIYNSICKSPAVEISDRFIGKRKRKVARFQPNYKSHLTKLEILTKYVPVRELIQNTVRKILEEQPDKSLELVNIRNEVSGELHCPPTSVYSAIEEMEEIRKFYNESKQVICKLEVSVDKYSELVNKLDDEKLVSEVKRALNLVNIESIDLALFQLGKIFEFTLRRYMQEVQNKDNDLINSSNMQNLYSMIKWAGENGVITDDTALHYLRIERNDRGHGTPPGLDERQALLRNSQTLIPFYLDYIFLLEQCRAKLNAYND